MSSENVRVSNSAQFNVLNYGAKGDGETLNTRAIQATIDAAHANGGGVVYFPTGRFLSGTIVLKDNVHLYLEAGSTLLGSTKREDYITYNPFTEPGANYVDFGFGSEHLIYAFKAVNIGIEGSGEINGQGYAFHSAPSMGWSHKSAAKWRPFRLLALVSCRNVTLRDVLISNAPCWTVWPYNCDGLKIQGIRIENDCWGPNTDGLDIDCCRNVFISDCHINCGDDSIAIKSSAGLLDEMDLACENITVTNCILRSTACGIRVGFEGDFPIRNCTFSNIVMSKCRTGICIQAPTEPIYHIMKGVPMENIRFSNIQMETRLAFFIYVGDTSVAPCSIRNIYFSDIKATTERGCFIGGSKTIPAENIHFSNIDLTVYGPMSDEFLAEVPYPYRVWDFWGKRGIPHAFFCRYAKGINFRNVRVTWQKNGLKRTVAQVAVDVAGPIMETVGDAEGSWASALCCENVQELFVDNFVSSVAPGPVGAPPIHLKDSKGTVLRDCRYAFGAENSQSFVKVEDKN